MLVLDAKAARLGVLVLSMAAVKAQIRGLSKAEVRALA